MSELRLLIATYPHFVRIDQFLCDLQPKTREKILKEISRSIFENFFSKPYQKPSLICISVPNFESLSLFVSKWTWWQTDTHNFFFCPISIYTFLYFILFFFGFWFQWYQSSPYIVWLGTKNPLIYLPTLKNQYHLIIHYANLQLF